MNTGGIQSDVDAEAEIGGDARNRLPSKGGRWAIGAGQSAHESGHR
jgi:hypothetical protein